MAPVVWLMLWLLLWAAPATAVSAAMARRGRRATWCWAIAGFVLGWAACLVLMLMLRAGRRTAVRPPDTAAAPEHTGTPWHTEWVTVGQWSGAPGVATAAFAVSSHRWRLHWQTAGQWGILGGMMQALLFRADGAPVINACLPNTTQPAQGVADLSTGPGRFSIRVNASGFSWEIRVEEARLRPGTPA